MTELTITTRALDAAVCVILQGEFDLAETARFQSALEQVEADEPAVIVIDLAAVDFMDSSGLRALIVANDRAREAGRRLAIVPGPPQLQRVFELTQLDQQLEFVEDASALPDC